MTPREQTDLLERKSLNFSYAYYAFTGFKHLVFFTGLAIVFVYKRESTKPVFVKAIWILLLLAEISGVANLILNIRFSRLLLNDHDI